MKNNLDIQQLFGKAIRGMLPFWRGRLAIYFRNVSKFAGANVQYNFKPGAPTSAYQIPRNDPSLAVMSREYRYR